MFCSTIIPSVGRASLARSVQSILDQEFSASDFEVIVVNDSGRALPAGAWQASPRVQVVETQRRGQGVAQNIGAALSRGRYLHFLDDDDWLLPGALASFWELAQRAPRADWLYGGVQLVDDDGTCLRECNPRMEGNTHAQMMAGVWIAVGSYLVRSEAFFAAGGNSRLLRTCAETDLARKVSYRGDMACTPAAVVRILRGAGWQTSTVWHPDSPDDNRRSRDAALSQPGAFRRLRASAGTPYWRGRIVQAYLAAARWNWQRGNFSTTASRTLYALLSLAAAGPSIVAPSYWQAVRDENVPFSADWVLRDL